MEGVAVTPEIKIAVLVEANRYGPLFSRVAASVEYSVVRLYKVVEAAGSLESRRRANFRCL